MGTNEINIANAYICGAHFRESDFERNLQYELLKLPLPIRLKRLKKDAIPTLNLPTSDGNASTSSFNTILQVKKRGQKRFVEEKLHDTSQDRNEETTHLHAVGSDLIDSLQRQVQSLSMDRDARLLEKASLETEKLELLERVNCTSKIAKEVTKERDALRLEIVSLKMETGDLSKQLTDGCATAKAEREAFRFEKESWECEKSMLLQQAQCASERTTLEIRKSLSRCFTPSQSEALISGCCVKRWTSEDVSGALTLRYFSPKAYEYLRLKLNIPLPHKSTLNRWVSTICVEPGPLTVILDLLRRTSDEMPIRDRLCILSFDECVIQQEWCYDKGSDIIYGPKRTAQCIMIRGLVKQWKQIVYYEFDQPMTKAILFDLIIKIEGAGFPVVATVNDMGSTNMKLWRILGVNVDCPSFTNPAVSGREVHVFADAPHLIKLIRNNFLDYGFRLNGHLLQVDGIKEIIINSVKDLKPTHKLTEKHIVVHGFKRMKVRPAVQLLSGSTARALRFYGERGLLSKEEWRPLSDFIELVDDWFDLFNSKVPYNKRASRNAYGTNLNEQNQLLEKMIKTVSSMRVCGKTQLFPFQKGIIQSCQALGNLYEMVKKTWNVSYLLTYRITQDGIEHFFGKIRQMGGPNDYPSPLSFKYRIRAHLLGREPGLLDECRKISKEYSDNKLGQSSLHKVSELTGEEHDTDHNNLLEEDNSLTGVYLHDIEDEQHIMESDLMEDIQEYPNIESLAEIEGLRYFGGFLAQKFKNYPALASGKATNLNTWIAKVERKAGCLTEPTEGFLSVLRQMEAMFISHHGVIGLQAGKKAVETLSTNICKKVKLPEEIVTYFVKCRVFFRIRILNDKKNTTWPSLKKVAKCQN